MECVNAFAITQSPRVGSERADGTIAVNSSFCRSFEMRQSVRDGIVRRCISGINVIRSRGKPGGAASQISGGRGR